MAISPPRSVRLLPQSDILKAAGTLVDFLAATTWEDAKEIAVRNCALLAQAVELLPDFIRGATERGEADATLLLYDYRQLLDRMLAHGPDKVGLADVPKSCVARWQGTRAGPLPSTAIEVVFLARPLVTLDAEYFSVLGADELDAIIEQWDRVVQHQGFLLTPLAWRLDALNGAGNCRLLRLHATSRDSDLSAAEGFYQTAIAASPRSWPNLGKYHHNLARGHFFRYSERSGDKSDLARAIQESESAVKLKPNNTLFLGELGMLLNERYEVNGLLADLEHAIDVFERAVRLSDEGTPDLPTSFNLLGSALRRRFVIKGNVNDIDRAVEMQRRSIEMISIDSENIPSRLTNLGNSLLEKASVSQSVDDLAEAIAAFAKATELSSPTDWPYPSRLNNLANGLSTRYRAKRDAADLSQAISLYRRAITLTPSHAQELPSRLYNLGNNLRERWTKTGQSKDEQEARESYEKACATGLERDRHWAFFAARNWGDWATARQSWQEAAHAYDYGLRVINKLIGVQSAESSKVTWLSQLQGFSTAAAFAFYKASDCQKAALALEQGRAHLLTEALQLNSLAVEQLRELGHTELVSHYEAAVDNWLAVLRNREDGSRKEPWRRGADSADKAKIELEGVLAAIRKFPGYESFAAPPSLSDIRAAAKLSPLVYLSAANAAGIALIVPRTEKQEIVAVELPELNEQNVRKCIERYQLSYLQREMQPKRWLATLDEVARWLWDACMSSVLERLARVSSACLIPCGLLGLLPFHASWSPSTNKKKQRRYAIERLRLTYAPNARALLAASQSDKFEGNTLLVISDPKPTRQPELKYAKYETDAARSNFHGHKVLRGTAATRSTVTDLLPHYEAVHFACHASAHTADPKRSGFILSGDEVLTLDELLRCRLMKTRLAVLSACETAVPGNELPDEVISLASVFLQAGVDGVIASLWAVLDSSTMLLMARFYQLWRRQRLSPSVALWQAQLWMLSASDRKKGHELRGLIPESICKQLARTPAGTNRFAHPDHWAAFGFVGF